jgi:hypothetical protein
MPAVKSLLSSSTSISVKSVLSVVVPRRWRSAPCLCLIASAAIVLLPVTARAENRLLAAALDSITVDELHEHVDLLAADSLEGRAAGSRGGQAAARYIESRLGVLGIAPAGENGRFTQPFYGSYKNVLARIDGEDAALRNEWIVVGAHYDHVGYGTPQNSNGPIGYIHNGADDNASGVAVLLETIEAFWQLPQRPRRSILFAFWDSEEQGLLGSRHWVNQPTIPLAGVRLSLNCDMVGRLRNGRLELGGTRSGFGLRRLMASSTLPKDMWIHYDWELKENSDHWPFFQRDIPVVLLHTGMHEDYHRPSDDVERVNEEGMRDVAAYLFDLVYRSANADELPRFRAAARSEAPFTQRERERPLAPLPPRLGIAFRDASEADLEGDRSRTDPVEDGAPPSPDAAGPIMAKGVVVTKVEPRSPAATAGLVVGDRVIAIGELEVSDERQFSRLVQSSPASTEITVLRQAGEEPVTLPLRLQGRPVKLGIAWRTDDAEPGAVYLSRVIPGSLAAQSGLRVHDRVYEIDGAAWSGTDAFSKLLNDRLEMGGPFTLGVERFGRLLDLEIAAGG